MDTKELGELPPETAVRWKGDDWVTKIDPESPKGCCILVHSKNSSRTLRLSPKTMVDSFSVN